MTKHCPVLTSLILFLPYAEDHIIQHYHLLSVSLCDDFDHYHTACPYVYLNQTLKWYIVHQCEKWGIVQSRPEPV